MVAQENITSGYLFPVFFEWLRKHIEKLKKMKDIIGKPIEKVFENNSKKDSKDTRKNKILRRRILSSWR